MTVTKPSTAAERKRAQRQRDRAALGTALRDGEGGFESARTSALLDLVPALLAGDNRHALAAVLIEIGRRGGVRVTASPAGDRSATVTKTTQGLKRVPT